MKAIQRFTDDYLQSCRQMSADQIVRFLDDFRRLHGARPAPSKLISMKVPTDLLNAFRAKAGLANTRYQTQIKKLMKAWVLTPLTPDPNPNGLAPVSDSGLCCAEGNEAIHQGQAAAPRARR